MTWDQYFISMAVLVGQKSKDPNTKVGAVVVDTRNCVIGVGFNGPPQGIDDANIPWAREGEPLKTKYLYICHAESNCLDFCDRTRLNGGKLFVSLFPCSDCAKRIIQARLSEVIYLSDKYHNTDSCIASRRMFDWAGIKYRQYTPLDKELRIQYG